MPVIGENEFLFGKEYTEEEALQLVDLGKKTTQAKNCMNCHTLLGNGAYYAPDLTKAWLDKGWISREMREGMMVKFLIDPKTMPALLAAIEKCLIWILPNRKQKALLPS